MGQLNEIFRDDCEKEHIGSSLWEIQSFKFFSAIWGSKNGYNLL